MFSYWLIRSIRRRTKKQLVMSAFEQLQVLKKSIAMVQDPQLLFLMNQKARQLEEQIEKIKQLDVIL